MISSWIVLLSMTKKNYSKLTKEYSGLHLKLNHDFIIYRQNTFIWYNYKSFWVGCLNLNKKKLGK